MRMLTTALILGLAVSPLAAVTINEIRIDQPSTDTDEYFELAGTPGELLSGLTYLVIGDGSSGTRSGVIESITSLNYLSIPADGYLLVAKDANGTLGQTADFVDTKLNFENGDNVTHLLVSGFSGTLNDDLDTNDDGVLDFTPWTKIIDMVALALELNPPSDTEWYYGDTVVGPDGAFVPGHVYRNPNGSGAWTIGQFDPVNGQDTPGYANVPEPATLILLGLGSLLYGRRKSRS